nr:response regulator [Sinorhizobium meliloti]
MAERVLIVDDDTRLSAMLSDYLSGNGYTVHTAATATAGIAELGRRTPDVVILDVMLPDFDGFETCRRIRAVSDVPVLMLTAKGEETDRIVGLELGADDYLPKPFNPRELLARLKAILRAETAAPRLRGPFASDGSRSIPVPAPSGSTAASVR